MQRAQGPPEDLLLLPKDRQPLSLLGVGLLHVPELVGLRRLADLVLPRVDGPVAADESVVVQAILHQCPAGKVELVERPREAYVAVAALEEGHRVGIVRPEQRREGARLRRFAELLELVQAHEGGSPEVPPTLPIQGGRIPDAVTFHEDGLAVAAEQRLGGRHPCRIEISTRSQRGRASMPALSSLRIKSLVSRVR